MILTDDTLEETLILDAPVAKVWAALTQPELMKRWFCTIQDIEGQIAVGEDVVLAFEDGRTRVHIVEIIPMACFAYRWVPAENLDAPVPDIGSSLVTFTLAEERAGTRLTMVESGLAALAPGARQRVRYLNSWGWEDCFNGLRKVLATEGELADAMHFQCPIQAPIERVWGLLSSVEGFRDGMGFQNFEGQIVAGGECFFTFGDERMRMRFESVRPMEEVSFRWTPGECSDAPIQESSTTLVTIQLIPNEGKTLLLLREEGFLKFLSLNGAHRFEMNNEGWGVEVLPAFAKYAEAK